MESERFQTGVAASFMSMRKLKQARQLLAAAKHNKREAFPGTGRIDANQTHKNLVLAGAQSADAVREMAEGLMRDAGIIKVRKDAVRAIEIVFSVPVGVNLDRVAFFSDAVEWAAQRFGGSKNILSADVHLDETQPHCHVLLLPLVGGRMVGSDLVGGPKALAGHQRSFREQVASRYGLNSLPFAPRGRAKFHLVEQVLCHLVSTADPATQSNAWMAVRSAIEDDPVPFAADLGISVEVQERRLKTMAAIFTSPGAGPKREKQNPKVFEPSLKSRSLSCVGCRMRSPRGSRPSSGRPELTLIGRLLALRIRFRPQQHPMLNIAPEIAGGLQ